MKREEKEQKDKDDDIEEILDSMWDNLSSRRKCESTHTPEYIKKQEE